MKSEDIHTKAKWILKNRITKELYFVTDTVVYWVDIFTRPKYKHILLESLRYCQKEKGFTIYAWALMSNHPHAIVSADKEIGVSDIWLDFKKFTSKKILAALEYDTEESRREWMLNRFGHAGGKGLLKVEVMK